MSFFEIREVNARHGLLHAVRDFDLSLDEGETVALVGANGAGKTTLLRTIAGVHPPSSGSIHLDGTDLTGMKAHRRVAQGIALVPEGRRLFPEMTTEENLLTARSAGRPGAWTLDAVYDAFPPIASRRHSIASLLSGGEQQMTAIGRALLTNPRVLLLDEVSLGLSPIAIETLYDRLALLFDGSATVILVEQNLDRAMSVSQRIVCMLEGRTRLVGASSELTGQEVVNAYFGLGKGDDGRGGTANP